MNRVLLNRGGLIIFQAVNFIPWEDFSLKPYELFISVWAVPAMHRYLIEK